MDSGGDIVAEVTALKKRKQQIERQLATTNEAQRVALQRARAVAARLCEDYAVKYFADSQRGYNSGTTFSSRAIAAINAMVRFSSWPI